MRDRAISHMASIMNLALVGVDLNFSGKHMAYHLSILMHVSVNTDTLTDTP